MLHETERTLINCIHCGNENSWIETIQIYNGDDEDNINTTMLTAFPGSGNIPIDITKGFFRTGTRQRGLACKINIICESCRRKASITFGFHKGELSYNFSDSETPL